MSLGVAREAKGGLSGHLKGNQGWTEGHSDADCIAVSLFNFPFRIRIRFSLFPLGLYFLF
jgi:hypothetical protein